MSKASRYPPDLKMLHVPFKILESLVTTLEDTPEKTGKTKSQVIRDLIQTLESKQAA